MGQEEVDYEEKAEFSGLQELPTLECGWLVDIGPAPDSPRNIELLCLVGNSQWFTGSDPTPIILIEALTSTMSAHPMPASAGFNMCRKRPLSRGKARLL